MAHSWRIRVHASHVRGAGSFSMAQETTGQQRYTAMVGMSLPRQDGPDKVAGCARYAGDQVVPGMLYARLVLSPYAHARILTIETSTAMAVPEVVAVFTAETLICTLIESLHIWNGSIMVKVDPFSSTLSTSMTPPCRLTISCEIWSPKPKPGKLPCLPDLTR